MKKYLSFLAVVAICATACKKNKTNPDGGGQPVTPDPSNPNTTITYTSNIANQSPLNMVYFIPTDFVSAFKTDSAMLIANVSRTALFAQKWYEKQMDLDGFGKKTFALFTDALGTTVKIVPIYGSKASASYTSNSQIKAEVDAYFIAHPNDKGGQHTMVVTNNGTNFPNNANTRIAFARSADNFNMVSTGKYIDDLLLLNCDKGGTFLHELGHALNAPHVAHTASENPKKSIMGGGGSNLYDAKGSEDKIFLARSSAAILNVSEAFNKNNNGISYYTATPSISLVSYAIQKDNSKSATVASFTFTSTVKPTNLYIGYDALPSAVNDDYDKVTFTTSVTATGKPNEYTTALEIPYSELFDGYQDATKVGNDIELTVQILTENGFRIIPLTYNFTNTAAAKPAPEDNINRELAALSDRSAWIITANTTTQSDPTGQAANKMIDSDLSTFWFSGFPTASASATPHIINVDMAQAKTFKGIYINSVRTPNPQFRPKHVIVQVSNDNTNFTTAADYTQIVENQDIKINFSTSATARYLKITVDKVYTGNGVENLTINELDIIR